MITKSERLGIDYGTVRIGLALGSIIPHELTTIANTVHVIGQIGEIVETEDVGLIVVGRPLRSNGEPGSLDAQIVHFIADLQSQCPRVTVETIDEAFSSTQARADLADGGVSAQEIENRVDQYAALLLLEQYNQNHPTSL